MAGAAKLLRRGQVRPARSPRSQLSYRCGISAVRDGSSLPETALDNVFFDLLDRDRRLIDAEHACRFAGCGADAAGELGEIIGRVQLPNRFFPASAIDQIVPVGNEIIDRAAGVAERYAAIHAACALACKLFFGEIQINLEPVVDALR